MGWFKKKNESDILIPEVMAPESEWDAKVEQLSRLGFRVFEIRSDSRGIFSPSLVKILKHEAFPAFGELSILPTGSFLVGFLTLFQDGSVRTFAGERIFTLSVPKAAMETNWKSGSLASVWQSHVDSAARHESEHHAPPLPAEAETYRDFSNQFEKEFEDAIRHNRFVPKTVCDYLMIGFGELRLGRIKSALTSFESAMRLDPKNGRLAGLAGRVALSCGDLQAAASMFSESLRLIPRNRETFLLLAQAHRLANEKRWVYETLKKAQTEFPEDKQIALEFGIAAVETGELADAQSNLEIVNTVEMASVELFEGLSKLHRKLGDRKKSEEYSRLAKVFAKDKGEWGRLPWKL